MAKLPPSINKLKGLSKLLDRKIDHYKSCYYKENEENKTKKSLVQDQSVPITADVRTFDYCKLIENQIKFGGRKFDVIMMDPPWQLSSSTPSRGVAIGYDSLADDLIGKLPICEIQTAGFLFIWVINAKYSLTCKQMEKWGYKLIDEIVWIKKTVNGKIAKGHGFYLQHAKETCLVGIKVHFSKYFKLIYKRVKASLTLMVILARMLYLVSVEDRVKNLMRFMS